MARFVQKKQSWEVEHLQSILSDTLLPLAESLEPGRLILPEEAGKKARGPYPPPPKKSARAASGRDLPQAIATYGGHRHLEWVFGFSGRAELALDGLRYELSEGDLGIVPPNVPHLERIADWTQPYHLLWFCIYTQHIRIHASSYSQERRFELVSGAVVLNCARICRLFLEGTEEALKREWAWDCMVRAKATDALVESTRHIKRYGLRSAGPHAFSLIELTKSHIQANYTKALTLKGIAQMVFLSPNYLSSLFTQATGQTVFDYIQEMRILEAQRLLRETRLPVREVAVLVGFRSATHFNRSFKRFAGVSPTVYRKQQRS